MADMPHVGYIDSNRSYSLLELSRVLRMKPDEALKWAARMGIPAAMGPSFEKNPLDILFAGRLVVMQMESQAVDLLELIPQLKELAGNG